LNEAKNVPLLVEQIGRALRGIDHEILIVDDNSADLTWSVAKELSATNPRVRILRRMENPGLGAAVIDGFDAATGDAVACIDADLQHDPSILSHMLEELQNGADVVVGSRHVDGGSTGNWNISRRFQSWIATKTAQLLLGVRLKDPMSGYFLVRRKDFSEIKPDLDGKGFKILLEIVAHLHTTKIKEVPYTFRPRAHGESKLSGKVILQYFHQIWRLCSSSRHFTVRFIKSAIVGGIGLFINLGVMAIFLKSTSILDWRASAIASLAANLQNYVLYNVWTYVAGFHTGFRKLDGYLSYLLMSASGMVVSTIAYSVFAGAFLHVPLMQQSPQAFYGRLFCQFVAVLLGIRFNYALNRVFNWPDLALLHLEAPPKVPILR
jgi:dolichol-phosphate mannosyltransferase